MAQDTSFVRDLERYMDAGMPIIYIDTIENGKVRPLVREAARDSGIICWNLANGLSDEQEGISQPGDLTESLDLLLADMNSLQEKVLLLEDMSSQLERSEVVARLRSLAEILEEGEIYATIVILAPLVTIPRELEPYVTLLGQDYPSNMEIKEKIKQVAQENGSPVPLPELLENLAMALRGLSETEIENVLALALVDDGRIDKSDLPIILKQKQQMIKKSGILEMVNVKETLSDIGGLENLKDWLLRKAHIFQNVQKARSFGVDLPKGVLITGMPGCGKSLTAKAAAKTFGVPLLRMDMGRLMGKYVGESEANMRQALRLTEASAPCVLWIDELEKAFAGVQAGGGGSEVTTRLFGNFLTWMQEKDSLAFVVATANNIAKLPPELLRKGRFDEIFYVDLPTEAERKKILEIHIKKRRPQDFPAIDLSKLVKETEGYCGADLEGAVRDSIEEAFVQEKEHLTTSDIEKAIKATHPITETMKKSLGEMKESYSNLKFRKASR